MNTLLNELIKLDWLMYYGNGAMPEQIKRYPHGEVKGAIQDYIKNNSEAFAALLGTQDTDSKSLLKNISYEVFYTDVLSNPEIEEEWIVFFGKDINGSLHHYSKKLSEVLA
jgi:hypothetical protein